MPGRIHPLALGMSYAGALLGAGFLTGREIVQFFVIYGGEGLVGIGLSTLGFGLFGWTILEKAHHHRASNYQELLDRTLHPFWAKLAQGTISFVLLGVAAIAIAGSNSLLNEILGLKGVSASLTTGIVLATLLASGPKGLAALNSILLPALILAGFSLVAALAEEKDLLPALFSFSREPWWLWLFSALLYLSYNALLAVGFLTALAERTEGKSDRLIAGTSGALALGSLLFLSGAALLLGRPVTLSEELPMLWLITDLWPGPGPRFVYSAFLWGGLLGTAGAALYGLGKGGSKTQAKGDQNPPPPNRGKGDPNLSSSKRRKKIDQTNELGQEAAQDGRLPRAGQFLRRLQALFLASLLASFGFTRLIATVYPAAGVLGLFFLIPLLFSRGRPA